MTPSDICPTLPESGNLTQQPFVLYTACRQQMIFPAGPNISPEKLVARDSLPPSQAHCACAPPDQPVMNLSEAKYSIRGSNSIHQGVSNHSRAKFVVLSHRPMALAVSGLPPDLGCHENAGGCALPMPGSVAGNDFEVKPHRTCCRLLKGCVCNLGLLETHKPPCHGKVHSFLSSLVHE